MAELIDALQKVTQNYMKNASLTDLEYGTVTSVAPLEVTVQTSVLPIPAALLVLTEPVIEKTIHITGHIHQITTLTHNHTNTATATNTGEGTVNVTVTIDNALTGTYNTETAQDTLISYENGIAQPTTGAVITINRGLAVGDKLVLLRVLNGQKYIILSRIF